MNSVYKFTNQRGATLIELMVGITIGLLTVTVGLGALMVSRSISGTVSEASQLNQQASYAFRVIGQQLRQAGSRQLDPDTAADVQAKFLAVGDPNVFTGSLPITGKDSPTSSEYALSVSYQNINDPINPTVPSSAPEVGYLMRNCMQEKAKIDDNPLIISQFRRDAASNSLVCAGTGAPQAIIQNVKDFRIQYLTEVTPGDTELAPTFQYVDADKASTAWLKVYAVQICIELEGTENLNTAGANYQKCDGSEVDRGNKLRMVFRNTYHIRNHAWLATS